MIKTLEIKKGNAFMFMAAIGFGTIIFLMTIFEKGELPWVEKSEQKVTQEKING